jgi:hypothetical protein
MPKYEFAGPNAQDTQNIAAAPGRLVNCYRRPADGDMTIVNVPGISNVRDFNYLDLSNDGSGVQAVAEVGGVAYAAHVGWLWRFLASGSGEYLDPIDFDENTTISGNNGDVTIVANGKYFVWDGAAVTQPTAGAFTNFGSVDFLNNYTLLTERNGRRVQWSAPANAKTLGGLDFATTESRDDLNIRGMTFGPEYWIFKQKSIERWYLNGEGNFEAIPGSTIDKGLKDFGLVCRGDLGGFFIATDGRAYLCGPGGAIQQVSPPGLHQAIAQGKPKTCMYYQHQGHEFYCVTFLDRPAWCFDLTTGEWHERAEGVDGPWAARHAAKAYGRFLMASSQPYVLEVRDTTVPNTVAADFDVFGSPQELVRRMIGRNLSFEGAREQVSRLVLPMRTGFDDFNVQLFVSRDRGVTFGDPKVRSVAQGDYTNQVTWRSMGQFRDFCIEVRITDPAVVPVMASCFLEIAS